MPPGEMAYGSRRVAPGAVCAGRPGVGAADASLLRPVGAARRAVRRAGIARRGGAAAAPGARRRLPARPRACRKGARDARLPPLAPLGHAAAHCRRADERRGARYRRRLCHPSLDRRSRAPAFRAGARGAHRTARARHACARRMGDGRLPARARLPAGRRRARGGIRAAVGLRRRALRLPRGAGAARAAPARARGPGAAGLAAAGLVRAAGAAL